ncbi:MAG: polysaccharide biosynthesis tyrosine autokinase [Bacteroidales bacterium]
MFSIFVSLFIAGIILRMRTPAYQGMASVFLQDSRGINEDPERQLLFREVVGMRELAAVSPIDEFMILSTSLTFVHQSIIQTRANISCYTRHWSGRQYYHDDAPIRLAAIKEPACFPLQFKVIPQNTESYQIVGKDGKKEGRFGQPFCDLGLELLIEADTSIVRSIGLPFYIEIEDPQVVATRYRKKLRVSPQGNSNIVTLSLTASHPAQCKLLLNTLINEYMNQSVRVKQAALDSSLLYVEQKIRDVKEELHFRETNEVDFKRLHKAANLSVEGALLTARLQQMENEWMEQEIRQQRLARFIRQMHDSSSGDLDPISFVPDENQLNHEIGNYNKDLAKLHQWIQSGSPLNPEITRLKEDILQKNRSIFDRVENLHHASSMKLFNLQQRMDTFQHQIRQLSATQTGVTHLVRDRRIKGALYTYLANKQEENGLLRAMVTPSLRVLDPVVVSRSPVNLPASRIIGRSLCLGGVFPLAFCCFLLLFDRRVKTKETIRRNVTAPVLGTIAKGQLDESPVQEGFCALQYALFYTAQLKAGAVVCVTSTMPGEGKTFISSNLARSAARFGKKVCLVGLDLRRPVLQSLFGYSGRRGVSDYLTCSDTDTGGLERLILPCEDNPFLSILPAGTVPPNPAELLSGDRYERMIEQLRSRFDVIILDTPPAEIVADTLLISRQADLSLYVVRVGVTDFRELENINQLYFDRRLPDMHLVINGDLSLV